MEKGKLKSRTTQHRFSLAFDEIVANHVNLKVSFQQHDCEIKFLIYSTFLQMAALLLNSK